MSILDARNMSPISGGASFSFANRLERVCWLMTWLLLARWTPPMFSPWRIWLLKLFGARVAPGAKIAASTRVWLPRNLTMHADAALGSGVECYSMAMITIGRRTIVSQRAHLCAGSHDVADRDFQLVARPITLGDDVWIAAEAFVAPGVSIADGVVLAARGCAFTALQPWTIYRGNPAQPVRARAWRQRQGREGASKETGSGQQEEKAT